MYFSKSSKRGLLLRAIPDRLKGVIMTRRHTNPRWPLLCLTFSVPSLFKMNIKYLQRIPGHFGVYACPKPKWKFVPCTTVCFPCAEDLTYRRTWGNYRNIFLYIYNVHIRKYRISWRISCCGLRTSFTGYIVESIWLLQCIVNRLNA